jgi:hypothetical protein
MRRGEIVLRQFLTVSLLCTSLAPVAGCIAVATPATGWISTDVAWDGKANGAIGTKEGKACASSILGIVASGDASIKAAAAAGGITNITLVDHHTKHFIFKGEYCTIVRGT